MKATEYTRLETGQITFIQDSTQLTRAILSSPTKGIDFRGKSTIYLDFYNNSILNGKPRGAIVINDYNSPLGNTTEIPGVSTGTVIVPFKCEVISVNVTFQIKYFSPGSAIYRIWMS